MDGVRRLINQLATLLDDKDLKNEFRTFKSAYQRLKIRLRNNHLIAHLKHLSNATRQLQDRFSANIIKTYADQLNTDNERKQKKYLGSLQQYIQSLIEFLDTILGQALFVYGYTQPHFRVGHLIHHLLVLRTCISRYRICMKALLVYSCDLYTEIGELKLVAGGLSKDELDNFLIKNNCKPRNLSAVITTKVSDKTVNSQDEVGQLIDRKSMKVEETPPTKRLRSGNT